MYNYMPHIHVVRLLQCCDEKGCDHCKLFICQLTVAAQSTAAHEEVDNDVEVRQDLRKHGRILSQQGKHRETEVVDEGTVEWRVLLRLHGEN